MQRTAPGARLLAGAVLFTLLLAGCGEPDTSPVGLHKEAADVNGDGRVGPADAYALAGYLLKPRPGNRLGDVNADGTVDWTDLLLLGRKLAPISKAAAPPPGEPDEPENGPPTPAPAPNATGISLFVLADVTGDGRVSPADAYALLAYLLEAREPSGTIGARERERGRHGQLDGPGSGGPLAERRIALREPPRDRSGGGAPRRVHRTRPEPCAILNGWDLAELRGAHHGRFREGWLSTSRGLMPYWKLPAAAGRRPGATAAPKKATGAGVGMDGGCTWPAVRTGTPRW